MPERRYVNHFDEAVAYILRTAIIGMLGWLIFTTNNTARMLDVIEWRMQQVEAHLAEIKRQ